MEYAKEAVKHLGKGSQQAYDNISPVSYIIWSGKLTGLSDSPPGLRGLYF